MVNFWRIHKDTSTAPHRIKDSPDANGAPAAPMRGAPQFPRMKAYSSGRFTRLTAKPNSSGVQALPAARSALERMISMAKPMMNAASQNMLREASWAAFSSKPNTSAIWRENSMPKIMSTRPTRPPNMSDAEVMRLASSRWPAPQERATRAVAPTPMAINSACSAKKTRCPAPTAATAGAPMLPTNLVCTMATIENIRLDAMEGAASCHIVGRVYLGGADSSGIVIGSLVSDLQDGRLSNPYRQQEVVKDADRDPGESQDLGGAIHFVKHIHDDRQTDQRKDQMSKPVAAAPAYQIVIDYRQMQQDEAGERAEIDYQGQVIDAIGKQQPHQQRNDGNHQRADVWGFISRMHLGQYRGKLAVARHGEENARDRGLRRHGIGNGGGNHNGKNRNKPQPGAAGALRDFVERRFGRRKVHPRAQVGRDPGLQHEQRADQHQGQHGGAADGIRAGAIFLGQRGDAVEAEKGQHRDRSGAGHGRQGEHFRVVTRCEVQFAGTPAAEQREQTDHDEQRQHHQLKDQHVAVHPCR